METNAEPQSRRALCHKLNIDTHSREALTETQHFIKLKNVYEIEIPKYII